MNVCVMCLFNLVHSGCIGYNYLEFVLGFSTLVQVSKGEYSLTILTKYFNFFIFDQDILVLPLLDILPLTDLYFLTHVHS